MSDLLHGFRASEFCGLCAVMRPNEVLHDTHVARYIDSRSSALWKRQVCEGNPCAAYLDCMKIGQAYQQSLPPKMYAQKVSLSQGHCEGGRYFRCNYPGASKKGACQKLLTGCARKTHRAHRKRHHVQMLLLLSRFLRGFGRR